LRKGGDIMNKAEVGREWEKTRGEVVSRIDGLFGGEKKLLLSSPEGGTNFLEEHCKAIRPELEEIDRFVARSWALSFTKGVGL